MDRATVLAGGAALLVGTVGLGTGDDPTIAAVGAASSCVALAALVYRASGRLLRRQTVANLSLAPGVRVSDVDGVLAAGTYRAASQTKRTVRIQIESLDGLTPLALVSWMAAALAWTEHTTSAIVIILGVAAACLWAKSRTQLEVELDTRRIGFGLGLVPVGGRLGVTLRLGSDPSSAVLEVTDPHDGTRAWIGGDRAQLVSVADIIARLFPDLVWEREAPR